MKKNLTKLDMRRILLGGYPCIQEPSERKNEIVTI